MVTVIKQPTVIGAAGNMPKRIEEYVGRVNSRTVAVSIAKMTSPAGWVEPGQRPEFTECTVVLKGALHLKTEDGEYDVAAGQAVIVPAGAWVQYSTPHEGGAEYLAVCLPAFSPETVHRDPDPADSEVIRHDPRQSGAAGGTVRSASHGRIP